MFVEMPFDVPETPAAERQGGGAGGARDDSSRAAAGRSAATPSARCARTSRSSRRGAPERGLRAHAGPPGDGRGLRRRHGRGQGAGHGAPLRHQHRHRPPHRRLRQRGEERGRAPRPQAHAPEEGPPAGSRRRGSPGRCATALLDAAGERLIDDRNRALLAVAYDTLLRRSELSGLQVTDLFEEMDGDATLLVRRSKTDREGEGETVWVAPDSLALVRAWLERGRHRGRVPVPLGRQGREARRGAAARPGGAHLQGDGARGRTCRPVLSTACRGTARGWARPRT